jgi:L-alanine-DL-glutamate epimerase-like enolase superfamily enzyme
MFGAMLLGWSPYTLELRQAFSRTATESRTATPAMLVELEHEGLVGHGEAAMPPYLGESQASATAFFSAAAPLLASERDPLRLRTCCAKSTRGCGQHRRQGRHRHRAA